MITFFLTFFIAFKSFQLLGHSLRIAVFKQIPKSYRFDIFGWHLLEYIVAISFVIFLLRDNPIMALGAVVVYFYLFFALPGITTRVVAEGMKTEKEQNEKSIENDLV